MSFAVATPGLLLSAAAMAGSAFAIFAGLRVGRYAQPAATPVGRPSVALYKPLHGAEPELADALRGFLEQDYTGRSHLWMGVQSPADAARGVAEAVAASSAGRAALTVDARSRGANAKVANLLNIADAAAPAEIVVLSDSDIHVRSDYLRALVAALEAPGVGVATCLYFGRASAKGVWPQWSAMSVSYGFLPLAAVGVAAGARPCMGSTIALSAETLGRIGGLERVKDVLADDYEIGRAVRVLGLEVVSPPFLVAHGCAETTLGEVWRHELRWSKTTQGLDPLGHAGSVVTHAIPLAVLACTWLAATAPGMLGAGVLALALSFAARLWLKGRVDRTAGSVTGPWWLLPIRDMMSFAVFIGAYLTARVEWRGARFHVGRGGELTPVEGPTSP